MTSIRVHDAGDTVQVINQDGRYWLDIPLSADRSARVYVYLEPLQCRRLAAELTHAADWDNAAREASDATGARA